MKWNHNVYKAEIIKDVLSLYLLVIIDDSYNVIAVVIIFVVILCGEQDKLITPW